MLCIPQSCVISQRFFLNLGCLACGHPKESWCSARVTAFRDRIRGTPNIRNRYKIIIIIIIIIIVIVVVVVVIIIIIIIVIVVVVVVIIIIIVIVVVVVVIIIIIVIVVVVVVIIIIIIIIMLTETSIVHLLMSAFIPLTAPYIKFR